MLDRYGETLTILYSYYLREQQPSFKTAMKRLVLRSKTCGVGWVKQGWRKAETRDTGKESLLDGPWPPNSARTIAMKGSDQPLIDTGRLNQSQRAQVELPGEQPIVVG